MPAVSPRAQRVLPEALQLPPKARADIAGTLLRSLDAKEETNVEEPWAAEVERRVAEVDSGKVKLVSWSQVRRRLRSGLRVGRAKR
jgi:putative addiction module component (TIGR02574 family)